MSASAGEDSWIAMKQNLDQQVIVIIHHPHFGREHYQHTEKLL
jgi:hypothetical protein